MEQPTLDVLRQRFVFHCFSDTQRFGLSFWEGSWCGGGIKPAGITSLVFSVLTCILRRALVSPAYNKKLLRSHAFLVLANRWSYNLPWHSIQCPSAAVFHHFPSAQLSALQFIQLFSEARHCCSATLLTNNRLGELNAVVRTRRWEEWEYHPFASRKNAENFSFGSGRAKW